MRIQVVASLAVAALAAACGSEFEQVTEGDIAVCAADLCAPNAETGIRFPQTTIGRSTNVQFQIRNTGDGPLTVNNIEIVGASPYIQFAQGFLSAMAVDNDWRANEGGQTWSQHPGLSLREGGEIQVDLVFEPLATDVECPGGDPNSCGTIVVTTNDRQNGTIQLALALTQSSGIISVDPTVLNFPDVEGGPFEQSFEVTNVGDGPLEIQSVQDPGVEGITLAETSNRQEPYDLGIGGTATYNVSFSPVSGVDYCNGGDPSEGCSLGQIRITSNDANGNQVIVSMQVGGSVPDVEVSEDSLTFNAAVGSPDTQTIDVSNVGGASLNWNLRIDPANVRDQFAIEVDDTAISSSGQQLSPLASENTKTVEITLDPASEDPIHGELVITTVNDPDEQVTRIDLFGGEASAELEVEPSQLYFNDVEPGDSVGLQLVIINPGRATLDIDTAIFSGSTEFSLAPELAGETVAPGDRMAVTVTYDRPDDDLPGFDNGLLTIQSNALPPNDEYNFNVYASHDDGALPPTAVIEVTPDEPYLVGEEITLDGSGSAAPDGAELASNPYLWTIIDLPIGSIAELADNAEVTASLVPDMAGTYTVMLTVTAAINETTNTQAQVTRNLLVTE